MECRTRRPRASVKQRVRRGKVHKAAKNKVAAALVHLALTLLTKAAQDHGGSSALLQLDIHQVLQPRHTVDNLCQSYSKRTSNMCDISPGTIKLSSAKDVFVTAGIVKGGIGSSRGTDASFASCAAACSSSVSRA